MSCGTGNTCRTCCAERRSGDPAIGGRSSSAGGVQEAKQAAAGGVQAACASAVGTALLQEVTVMLQLGMAGPGGLLGWAGCETGLKPGGLRRVIS
eukprot:scaffold68251_cov63-Phaeocystis_antarctica.AAC.1